MKNSKSPLTPFKKAKPPTQAIVAREAGVSQETVSHILGNKANRYHPDTRSKVLEAAKKLNYRPNKSAQMMRKGRSNLIGIIHFGTGYQSAKEAVRHLPQALTANGYDLFVVDLSWQGSHRRAIEQLVDLRVEGVIISNQVESFGMEEVEILSRAGVPTVTLSGNEKLGIPSVYGDSSTAFTDMVRHLHRVGHRRLLLLTNTYEGRPTLSRIKGFQKGIQEFSDTRGEIVRLLADQGRSGIGTGAYQYVRELITSQSLPDAILCTNDQWARGVFAAALEAGLRIPEDLAVTGFDNEPFGAQAPYYLTTAAPDFAEECGKAVEVLMDLIAGRPLPQQHYIFPSTVIVRRSCGASVTSSI